MPSQRGAAVRQRPTAHPAGAPYSLGKDYLHARSSLNHTWVILQSAPSMSRPFSLLLWHLLRDQTSTCLKFVQMADRPPTGALGSALAGRRRRLCGMAADVLGAPHVQRCCRGQVVRKHAARPAPAACAGAPLPGAVPDPGAPGRPARCRRLARCAQQRARSPHSNNTCAQTPCNARPAWNPVRRRLCHKQGQSRPRCWWPWSCRGPRSATGCSRRWRACPSRTLRPSSRRSLRPLRFCLTGT